jgi:glutaredoxin|tara:strand:- start:163 stop:438 length:276 start_codon:yes stop_codon:yes gene_type:complete
MSQEKLPNVIYSKPNCPYCTKAKELLSNSRLRYTEIIIGKDISVERLMEEFDLNGMPRPKSAPQIILHGKYVGGYKELEQYYQDHDMWRDN